MSHRTSVHTLTFVIALTVSGTGMAMEKEKDAASEEQQGFKRLLHSKRLEDAAFFLSLAILPEYPPYEEYHNPLPPLTSDRVKQAETACLSVLEHTRLAPSEVSGVSGFAMTSAQVDGQVSRMNNDINSLLSKIKRPGRKQLRKLLDEQRTFDYGTRGLLLVLSPELFMATMGHDYYKKLLFKELEAANDMNQCSVSLGIIIERENARKRWNFTKEEEGRLEPFAEQIAKKNERVAQLVRILAQKLKNDRLSPSEKIGEHRQSETSSETATEEDVASREPRAQRLEKFEHALRALTQPHPLDLLKRAKTVYLDQLGGGSITYQEFAEISKWMLTSIGQRNSESSDMNNNIDSLLPELDWPTQRKTCTNTLFTIVASLVRRTRRRRTASEGPPTEQLHQLKELLDKQRAFNRARAVLLEVLCRASLNLETDPGYSTGYSKELLFKELETPDNVEDCQVLLHDSIVNDHVRERWSFTEEDEGRLKSLAEQIGRRDEGLTRSVRALAQELIENRLRAALEKIGKHNQDNIPTDETQESLAMIIKTMQAWSDQDPVEGIIMWEWEIRNLEDLRENAKLNAEIDEQLKVLIASIKDAREKRQQEIRETTP